MGNFGGMEVVLIVGAIIVLFGAKKLPEIARSVGKAKGEFKKGLEEGDSASRDSASRD
jgi:sec-independent protein translocase protein TatA